MVLVVVVVLIWNFSTQFQTGDASVTFSEFVRLVDSGQVEDVVLTATRSPERRPRVAGSGPTHPRNTKGWSTNCRA